jgi:hypothetical protein
LPAPVHILEGLAGHRVGEAILVEQLAFGDDGPAAREMMPQVGLIVSIDGRGDKHQGRRQQGPHPTIGGKQQSKHAQL